MIICHCLQSIRPTETSTRLNLFTRHRTRKDNLHTIRTTKIKFRIILNFKFFKRRQIQTLSSYFNLDSLINSPTIDIIILILSINFKLVQISITLTKLRQCFLVEAFMLQNFTYLRDLFFLRQIKFQFKNSVISRVYLNQVLTLVNVSDVRCEAEFLLLGINYRVELFFKSLNLSKRYYKEVFNPIWLSVEDFLLNWRIENWYNH